MRNYPAFPRATPHRWAGSPRVPHPSATFLSEESTFDLHALGTPPALILSQDQTLHQNGCLPTRKCDRTLFHIVRASSPPRLICPTATRKPLQHRPARRSSIFGRPLGARPPSRSAHPPQKGRPSSRSLASHPASNLSRCGASATGRSTTLS